MTTRTRNTKPALVHKLLAAAVLVAGLGTVTFATPASAHDGWNGERPIRDAHELPKQKGGRKAPHG